MKILDKAGVEKLLEEHLSPDEIVWLVSFPRSGNTWLRLIFARLQYPELDCSYRKIDSLLPDIHQSHKVEAFFEEQYKHPIFLKSHWADSHLYRKAIYIFRDVRDVVVSNFHFHTENNGMTFETYFSNFLIGAVRHPWFGSWPAHVHMWTVTPRNGIEIFLVKYEELLAYPEAVVTRLVKFAGLKCSKEDIQRVVVDTSYANLKKRAPGEGASLRRVGLQGTSKGWKKILTNCQKKAIWSLMGGTLRQLGYTRRGA